MTVRCFTSLLWSGDSVMSKRMRARPGRDPRSRSHYFEKRAGSAIRALEDWYKSTPLQENGGVGGRIDIDLVEVAIDMWQLHKTLVHNFEPKPWQISEHIHTEIPIWQLRQILKMPQRLVATQWMGMVIGVSLQVEQNKVAKDVVAVPRMMRRTAL